VEDSEFRFARVKVVWIGLSKHLAEGLCRGRSRRFLCRQFHAIAQTTNKALGKIELTRDQMAFRLLHTGQASHK
jgi:hypothetical protein